MRIFKDVIVVALATAVTIVVVLGATKLPGGKRLAGSLSTMAEQLFYESFDVALEREKHSLQYPEHADFLHHLAMMQVAEHARQARLKAINGADIRGWQVPLPRVAEAGAAFHAPLWQSPASLQTQVPVVLAPEKRANAGWTATLIAFVFALAFAFAARLRQSQSRAYSAFR